MTSRNKPLSNKSTSNAHKDELCPNRLNTGQSSNDKIPPIKIIKQKLSIDTGVDPDDNANNWQLVTSPTKRINSPGTSPNPKIPNNQNNIFPTPNRYSSLNIEDNTNNTIQSDTEMESDDIIIKAPPPIFIKSIINNYQQFCEAIKSLHTPPMEFSCKTTSNSLKLTTPNPNSYRTVIRYLKEKNVNFYTYQIHEDKPYRVVVKNLHPSTSTEFIKEELGNCGFSARNITNVLHYQSKSPLPLFFVDLEPALNNKEIFELKYLCYTNIKVEAPRTKKQIPQCMNCQDYGHTRHYCNNIPRCVRCGDQHSSNTCTKSKDLPAKCALCFGDHPANYRGCPSLKNIQNYRNRHSSQAKKNNLNNKTKYTENNNVPTDLSHNITSEYQKTSTSNLSYAQATQNKNSNETNNQPHLDPTSQLTTQLTSFINELKSLITPLILLLTKTHLSKTANLSFSGYSTIRADHPDGTSHGGSAIIIKSSLFYNQMHNINQPYLQAANIKIKINHLNVTISSAYFPPGQQITEPKLKSFIQSLGSFFIIGGDFNAKHTQWGSRYTNTRGRLFHTSILKNKLSFISPDEPTYWPAHENRSPDILDFFITSIPTGLKYHIKNLNELSSDHSPIQLTIGAFPASSPTTSLSSGPIDWKIFQQKLDISLSLNFPLKRSSDIDNAISILTNSIQNAISTSSSPNPNKNQPKYPTSLPTYLVDLIKAKRQARSLWQRTKYPIHKTIYNHLITDLKTQLAKFRSEQFSKHLSTLTPNNGSLWKMTKKLINHRDNIPPLERPDKSLAISDLEKANLFCDHLSSSFSPHSDLASSPDHVNLVNSFLSSPLPMSLPAKSISPAEIVSVIHKLRPNKSPGHDQITNKIAKNLPKKAILFLTHIYNAMLRLSYFPPTWKYSIIIMISKPNKPKHLTSSYRPISLLPTFAKLFEKLILHRISLLVDQHNILPKSQFGFRRKHNTIHQIHRITDKISASFETKQYCPGVFLDISKAFDRVWHDGLLFKLKHFLPSPYYLILKSYLENRSFSVRQKK
ncbi:hypothetical protein QTP88_011151 [Uroleucon formosanum]